MWARIIAGESLSHESPLIISGYKNLVPIVATQSDYSAFVEELAEVIGKLLLNKTNSNAQTVVCISVRILGHTNLANSMLLNNISALSSFDHLK